MIFQGMSKTVYNVEENKIAGGGEGSIHLISGNENQVAKIFKPGKRDAEREEKLRLMVQTKLNVEQLKQVTWPQDVIYDQSGFAGYIMPKLENSSSLTEIYTSDTYDLRYRLMTAVNLCAAIDTVHSMGQVCGDLNPQNICVNLNKADRKNAFKVTLVDTDSYHFTSGGKTYRCEVGLGDFLAPELQNKLINGRNLKSISLPSYTKETDLFALAVHIFYLLMNGCHPFACAKEINRKDSNMAQLKGGATPDSVVAPQPVENIKSGYFPFYKKKTGMTIPIYAPEFTSLPESVRHLFIRTFVDGYYNPSARVSAAEWQNALIPLIGNISICEINRSHYYFNNIQECPLCKIEENIKGILGEVKEDSDGFDNDDTVKNEKVVTQQKKNALFRVRGKFVATAAVVLFLVSIAMCMGILYIYDLHDNDGFLFKAITGSQNDLNSVVTEDVIADTAVENGESTADPTVVSTEELTESTTETTAEWSQIDYISCEWS